MTFDWLKAASRPFRHGITGRLAPSQISYSGAGEDLVAFACLMHRGIEPRAIRYLDIGAADPVELSNTFLFYCRGGRGVLVEPDPRYTKRIKAKRPRDVLVSAGVSFDQRRSAEFTLFTNPVFNTFSSRHAQTTLEQSAKWHPSQRQRIVGKTEVPLIPVNEILQQHFSGQPPHLISIDAEGCDFEILKTIDFGTVAPLVLCIERQASIEQHLDVIGRNSYELVYQNPDNLLFVKSGPQ